MLKVSVAGLYSFYENQERLQQLEDYNRQQSSAPVAHPVTIEPEQASVWSNSSAYRLSTLEGYVDQLMNDEPGFPLVVLCDNAGIMRYAIMRKCKTAQSISAEQLKKEGALFPGELLFTQLSTSPMSKSASACITAAKRLIKQSSQIDIPKRIIVMIEDADEKVACKAWESYKSYCRVISYRWNNQLLKDWMKVDDVHPMLAKYLSRYTESSEIPSFNHIHTLAGLMSPLRELNDEDLLMALLQRKLHIEYDDFVLWLFKLIHSYPDGDQHNLEYQKLVSESCGTAMKISIELEEKYPIGCELLRQHGLPLGWEKCNREAYLSALQDLTKILSCNMWPKLFIREITCWIYLGDIANIPMRNYSEWTDFLSRQYFRQVNLIRGDNSYRAELEFFCKMGFPRYWFEEDYDQKVFLNAVSAFLIWVKHDKYAKEIKDRIQEWYLVHLLQDKPDCKTVNEWARLLANETSRQIALSNKPIT